MTTQSASLAFMRRVANWALRRWRFVVGAVLLNLVALSAWNSHGTALLHLPVVEVLAACLLVNLALLWVTLLADHRSSRSAIWSRLGPLPDAFQALVAATLLLALGLAVLVLVDGLVGILDALRQ